MTKRKASSVKRRKTRGRRAQPKGRLRPLLGALFVWLLLIGAAWSLWVDYRIRTDFGALQWALPGRIYARPMELYEGARFSAEELTETLQRLGYRQSPQVSGPGEYQVSGATVRLRTRGFDFWDGQEPGRYIEISFAGRRVSALRGPRGEAQALLRLEPVEIAQINPETGEDRLPVALEEVPEALVRAVIAVEDQRFYRHFGIDPIGILRALAANIRAGEVVQGGSTLTQQLVKNLYLNRERTLRRKVEEAVMALALELHFSKDEILNAYLNEVYLGQDGNRAIHGFALAARHYFGRPLNELRLDELAALAALPRGASYYNPLRYPERATARRNLVLALMEDQGYISAAQRKQASAATLQTRPQSVKRPGYPAFMELVYSDLARDYDGKALRSAGLRIFTTLDVGMQGAMEARLGEAVTAVEKSGAKGLEAAMVITDASTGEVRALAGSRNPGYTGFNRALKARRQIGSLVKPAVYLAALERPDFTLASVLADAPLELRLPDGQRWRPQNYENKTFGEVYLVDALERSLNLATVDLGLQLGVDKVAAMLGRLGFEAPVQPYPSLLLGAVDMTPLEVADIYQTLAGNGFRSPLRSVEAVTTATGEPLKRYGISTSQAVDPASVYLLEYAMQGVFERGTARSVRGKLDGRLPLAGKTGTTNDTRDSWFAGFGDDLLGVVWLGHDDNRETGLTGATGALQVWTAVMAGLDIQPRRTPPPPDIVWEKVVEQAVRDPARRDCSLTRSLAFQEERRIDVAFSCEVTDSFFERVLNRAKNRGQ